MPGLRVAVLGAGAWGTALALAFSARHQVALWSHAPAEIAALAHDRENKQFLPGFSFPDALQIEADLAVAVRGADVA
ncbi:MAG TPA: glycerol-3-phosphate dehydrogenase, partial [Rhodocyclaceae bacterium]|nr:glycerol-3-phosphate dehydrogenase [Rhodocyclaceae bacterium]